MSSLKILKSYPLSENDIKSVEKTNIFKLDDIVKLNHIDECLDRLGRCIFLIQNINENTGHWSSLIVYDNICEIYEGYGLNKNQLIKLDKDMYKLFILIKNSGYKLILNNHKRQELSPYINTCGRYALIRIMLYQKNLKQFNNFLSILETKNYNIDDLISILTFLFLGK